MLKPSGCMDLPPHLERQLLDLFSGVKRRGVPFEQKGVFPTRLH